MEKWLEKFHSWIKCVCVCVRVCFRMEERKLRVEEKLTIKIGKYPVPYTLEYDLGSTRNANTKCTTDLSEKSLNTNTVTNGFLLWKTIHSYSGQQSSWAGGETTFLMQHWLGYALLEFVQWKELDKQWTTSNFFGESQNTLRGVDFIYNSGFIH